MMGISGYDYIVFTSKKDDLSGEDLTAGSTSGTRADYKYAVYLRQGASTDCVIRYCKLAYAYYAIRTEINSPDLAPIENNIISYCRYGMVLYRQTDVKNNLITDCNEVGIYAQHGGSPQYQSLISNNTFNACYRALMCYWTNVDVTAKYNLFSGGGYGVYNMYGYATVSLDYNAYYHIAYSDVYNCTKGPNDVTLAHNNYPNDSPFDSSPLGNYYLKDSMTQLKAKPCPDPEMGFDPDFFTTRKPEVASASITGNATWEKVPHEATPYLVDIGYHHNRVDYYMASDCIVSGGDKSLTISPGVAVAISGFSFLYPASGARLTCVGEPLGAGYNVITNSKSASMLIQSPVVSASNPMVIIGSDASAQSAIEYTKFTWLTCGLWPAGNIPNVVKNNIFAMNHYGVYKSGGAFTCFNNLFHHNNMGARLLSGDAILYNNTFDSNTTAIDYERSAGHILFFKDNLFTLNGQSVALRYSGDDCQHNYNVYWGTPPHIYDYVTQSAVEIGPQSRELVSSPYDAEKQGWEGGWYLKQKPDDGEAPEQVLAVDCGSQSAQMSGLDELTTSINLKPDTGVVDIASHHPLDPNRDSDSDTMPDWWEDLHGLDPYDPGDADSDADEDTIYASQEYQGGTNPDDEDSDHDSVSDADDPNPTGRTDRDTDGMTDDWEQRYGLNPASSGDRDQDPDSDGLTNWEEWNLDTDPTNPDTDSDGIPDGLDKDPNGPKLTIVSLKPPKSASSETQDEYWHPALVTSSPVFRLAGIADARLRNVRVVVNDLGGENPGYAAIIEPTKFEMKCVPLGGEGKYNIMVKAYDFDGNEAYAFTQVEVSYTAPPIEAWIKVNEAVVDNRNGEVSAAFGPPEAFSPPSGFTLIAGYINSVQDTQLGDDKINVTNLPLHRGANVITARLVYTYGAVQYEIIDTGTVYFHVDYVASDQWTLWQCGDDNSGYEVQYRDHDWYYDTSAGLTGYFDVNGEYDDCRGRQTQPVLGAWELASDFKQAGISHVEHWIVVPGPPEDIHHCTNDQVISALFRTKPVIGLSGYDYLIYVTDVSPFPGATEPLGPGYTLDGKPLIYLEDDSYVVRERLSPASDYSPVIHAPDAQDPDNPTDEYLKGYRLICSFPQPDSVKPYYIMLSLRKGPDPDHCEDIVDIGDPIVKDEWVDVLATYNPYGGDIEWEHSPSDPGWTGEFPFKPEAIGEHTITARYYAHPDEPERDLVGYVEDKVTFVLLPTPGVQLISEVPKDTLLIGERMPLTARFVNLNGSGTLESIIISPAIWWRIVEGETVAKTDHWRELWYEAPPGGEDHTEWWFTGTIAGVAEGTVKVQAFLTYWTPGYPMPQIHVLTGPVHEIEVGGFVDVRIFNDTGGFGRDHMGEWGEEDPGAFMAANSVDEVTLRTCTAGDVVLSWNSENIGLYTGPECEEWQRVPEDNGSAEGSHRATFTPTYQLFPHDIDAWGVEFRATLL